MLASHSLLQVVPRYGNNAFSFLPVVDLTLCRASLPPTVQDGTYCSRYWSAVSSGSVGCSVKPFHRGMFGDFCSF